jgi:glycosyltransferase involved in cell wall biosynthesis
MIKKKILFVDHDPNITGSTISMKYLIKGFSINKCEVILLSPKTEKPLEYFKDCQIKIIRLEHDIALGLHFTNILKVTTLRGILDVFRLIKKMMVGLCFAVIFLKRIKPDLVYVNEYVLLQFSIAGKLCGISTACHIRSPFIKGTFGIRRYILAKLLLSSNQNVFAISEQEAKQITQTVADKKKIIKIIYEFLDESDYTSEYNIRMFKELLSIPINKKMILMAGGVESVKGTFEMIEAFSKLLNKKQDIYLIIAGTVNNNSIYNKKCFDFIEKRELTNSIKIINYTSQIHEIIACSDVIISSSNVSHFSRPIIEAWAQKKAVISSNTNHAMEFIEDGKDGMLFEIGNSDSLANKLFELFSDEKKMITLGEAGYKKAKNMFDAEIGVNKVIQYCLGK